MGVFPVRLSVQHLERTDDQIEIGFVGGPGREVCLGIEQEPAIPDDHNDLSRLTDPTRADVVHDFDGSQIARQGHAMARDPLDDVHPLHLPLPFSNGGVGRLIQGISGDMDEAVDPYDGLPFADFHEAGAALWPPCRRCEVCSKNRRCTDASPRR